MTIQMALSISLSAFAVLMAVAAFMRASARLHTNNLMRKIGTVQLDISELQDAFERMLKNQKRATARVNMAKAREKKNSGKDSMTDDEWRAWATRRVQQGLPIDGD